MKSIKPERKRNPTYLSMSNCFDMAGWSAVSLMKVRPAELVCVRNVRIHMLTGTWPYALPYARHSLWCTERFANAGRCGA